MSPADATALAHRTREVIARTFRLPAEALAGPLRMGDPPQWDSLAHMNLVMELESEFEVTVPTYAIAELTSDAAIVEFLLRQRQG